MQPLSSIPGSFGQFQHKLVVIWQVLLGDFSVTAKFQNFDPRGKGARYFRAIPSLNYIANIILAMIG